jgi:hypothetical protein
VGKHAAIFIKPSLGVSNWPVILLHHQTQSSFLAPSSPRHHVPLADVAKKKPLGRINDVLIMFNNNLIPVDFLIMDVEYNASCPIILGRPFL